MPAGTTRISGSESEEDDRLWSVHDSTDDLTPWTSSDCLPEYLQLVKCLKNSIMDGIGGWKWRGGDTEKNLHNAHDTRRTRRDTYETT